MAVAIVSILVVLYSVLAYQLNIDKCINNIIEEFYEEKCMIYVAGTTKINYPAVQIDLRSKFMKTGSQNNVDIYILQQKSLNETVLNLSLSREFTPRALFIIISQSNGIEDIFPIIAKYYIYRVLIISGDNEDLLNLYSYKPFADEHVIKTSYQKQLFGRCVKDEVVLNDTFEDFPDMWRNTTSNILIKTEWKPYVYWNEATGDLEGIEVEIFRIIQDKLRFKTRFIDTNELYWGTRQENGSYNMVLGLLEQKKGDMVMGMFHTKFSEHLDFDITFSFSQDAVYWVVPAAKILPAWRRISLIFSVTVWLGILISLLVLTIVMYLLYQQNFLYILYQILLEHGVFYLYTSNSFRVILTVWTLSSLVLTTAFKSNMMIVFIGNIFGYQIESLQDIVKSGLPIYLDHDIANVFKDSSNPYETYVQQNYKFSVHHRETNNRTAFVGDIITSDVKEIRKFLFPSYYVVDGVPLNHMLDEFLFMINVNWFFVKGYPLRNQINKYLMRISSAGITFKLWDKLDYEVKKALGKMEKFQLKNLGLEDLSIAFFLWSFGVIISTIVFIFEVLRNRARLFKEK